MQRITQSAFARFCMVGGLGFAINFALLTMLYKELGWPLFAAQLLSGEVALFNNFLLHHYWTYRGHGAEKTIARLLVQFHVTSWLAIVGTALTVNYCVVLLHLHYVVALGIGGGAALGWNYVWSRFVIWRRHKAIGISTDLSISSD